MHTVKYPQFFPLLGLFFASSALANTLEKPPLFLKVGEQRILSLAPQERYSMSGKAIRYTRLPGPNQLLIKALFPGISNLFTTSPQASTIRTIRVEGRTDSAYPKPLLQALNQLESIEAIDGGTHFVLRGEVRQGKEARSIAFLKQQFSNWIIDETTLDPQWIKSNLQELSAILKNYPEIKARSHDGLLLIQGAVIDSIAQVALTKKIHSIQPLAELEIQTFKGYSPTLFFKVFLLEVKKEYTSRLGTEITQPIPLQSLMDQTLSASIHALSEKGMVRVLSAPELVVKSPGQAELFAGGELPYRLRSRNNDQILWKNVGLSLKLDVKEYNGEKVRLTVETELNHQSEISDSDHFPEIKTNRIKTQVESIIGKPLLLSGLIQEATRERMSGILGISEIPILGKLFGSEDFQKNLSELAAILLPYREPPPEPMQRIASDIPKGFLPLHRNHLSDEELENLKNSREYPWNAL
jgi:hypothetical protein